MSSRPLPRAISKRENREVVERLNRLAPGLRPYVLEAWELLEEDPPKKTLAHLVGHLAREVESGVRAVVLGLVGRRTKTQGTKQNHLADVNAVLADLGLSAHPDAESWRAFASDESWHRVAHRNDLGAPREHGIVAERWTRFVAMLRVVLDAVEAKFLEVARTVDALAILDAPTQKDVDSLKECLPPESIAADRFLKKATAGWLPPLVKCGFFDAPPDPVATEKGHSYPVWSQSLYLDRIALVAPDLVTETILRIPATENMTVYWHFLQAAAVMPWPYAAQVSNRVTEWLAGHPEWSDTLAMMAEPLATKLAREGGSDAALRLVAALLQVQKRDDSDRRHTLLDALYLSAYHMRALCSGPVRELSAREPQRMLTMLCDSLQRAQGSQTSLWRTAIESDSQNIGWDAMSLLLDSTRDLACSLAGNPAAAISVAVELERRPHAIFRRLALHTLRCAVSVPNNELATRLASPNMLADRECFHEVAMILKERFGTFTPEEQAAIRDAMRVDASRAAAEEQSEADATKRRQVVVRMWFELIEPWLPADDRQEFEALIAETGRWEHLGFSSWHSRGRPRPTQFKYEDVAALQDADLLQTLAEHADDAVPATPFDDDEVGLEGALSVMANQNPERLVRLAAGFTRLSPRYVRIALSAADIFFRNRRDEVVDEANINDVLLLCEETVSDRAVRDAKAWLGTQREAADVILAMAHRLKRGPVSQLERATLVVEKLAKSEHPAAEQEPDVVRPRDSVTFAVSTVRGAARSAAIALLSEESGAASNGVLASVKTRLKALVDAALDPAREPSATLRASIARHYASLYVADKQWATSLAGKLFGDVAKSPGTHEGWRVFLEWHHAHTALFAALESYYAASARRVADYDKHSSEALGAHLVDLVAYGCIEQDAEGNPVADFVDRADASARSRALDHVGRKLHATGTVDPKLLERVQALWTWWRTRVQERIDRSELQAFGAWFGSARFDHTWALAELERVLTLTDGHIQWDNELLDVLAADARNWPDVVTRCMKMLIDGSDPWLLIGSEGIRNVVAALRTTESGQRWADEVRSRLLAHGFGEVDTEK